MKTDSTFLQYLAGDDRLITEMNYPGNIGFMEMVQFYQKATPDEKAEMEEIIKNDDWEGFKNMIRRVVGTQLQSRKTS